MEWPGLTFCGNLTQQNCYLRSYASSRWSLLPWWQQAATGLVTQCGPRESEAVHFKETAEAVKRCCMPDVPILNCTKHSNLGRSCTLCIHVYAQKPASDTWHSPGDCGLGETTANRLGEDFGGIAASLSFCTSLLEAVWKTVLIYLFKHAFNCASLASLHDLSPLSQGAGAWPKAPARNRLITFCLFTFIHLIVRALTYFAPYTKLMKLGSCSLAICSPESRVFQASASDKKWQQCDNILCPQRERIK